MGRALIRGLQRREEAFTLAGGGAALAIAALLPLLWPIANLLESGMDDLRSGLGALAGSRAWILLARSLGIAAATTAAALAIGVPAGFLLERTDVPGRRPALLLHAFPMFLPPFLLALGWFAVLGVRSPLGGEWTSRLLFSDLGVIAVLALTFAPVATALTALGLRGIDASIEEAARAVAGPFRVAARILLPAVWPSIALAALIIFSLAFSELAVPNFLRSRVYPSAVFARLGGIVFAPGEAFFLALPVLPVILAMLLLERRIRGRRSFAVLGLRGTGRAPMRLGRWRAAAAILSWLLAAVSILPVAALAVRAGFRGFAAAPEWIGSTLWNSLAASAAAATLITAIGIAIGHAAARRRRGAAALDALAVIAFVTPAAVLGAGLIGVWNRPGTESIYRGLGIIVLGFTARYAVVGIRAVAVSISQSSPHLEESAAAFGAGYLRRLFRIVLPVHRRGIAGAWLLALVFCLRDVETAILYYSPGCETLTVGIYTLEGTGPQEVVAALAAIHAAVTAAALAIGAGLLRRGVVR